MTSDTSRNIHSYSKYIYKCCSHSDIKIVVEWNPLKRRCWGNQLSTCHQIKCVLKVKRSYITQFICEHVVSCFSLPASPHNQAGFQFDCAQQIKKSSLKEKNPTWTYMNTTARRIENLFQKSGIVFLHLPVITAQPPEAEGGNAQSPLLCHAFVN